MHLLKRVGSVAGAYQDEIFVHHQRIIGVALGELVQQVVAAALFEVVDGVEHAHFVGHIGGELLVAGDVVLQARAHGFFVAGGLLALNSGHFHHAVALFAYGVEAGGGQSARTPASPGWYS